MALLNAKPLNFQLPRMFSEPIMSWTSTIDNIRNLDTVCFFLYSVRLKYSTSIYTNLLCASLIEVFIQTLSNNLILCTFKDIFSFFLCKLLALPHVFTCKASTFF